MQELRSVFLTAKLTRDAVSIAVAYLDFVSDDRVGGAVFVPIALDKAYRVLHRRPLGSRAVKREDDYAFYAPPHGTLQRIHELLNSRAVQFDQAVRHPGLSSSAQPGSRTNLPTEFGFGRLLRVSRIYADGAKAFNYRLVCEVD